MITPEENMKSMGFSDMHEAQIEELLALVMWSMRLAAGYGDQEILDETEALCDSLVRIFGGEGVSCTHCD